MQLAILLAVVCALAQGEDKQATPAGDALWRAVVAALGMLAAPLAAAIGARGLTRAIDQGAAAPDLELRLARLERGSTFLWLAAVAATMYIIHWPQVVRHDFGLATWPLIDELLILAPVVLPLLLVWGAMYGFQWHCLCWRSRHQGAEAVPFPALPPWRPVSFVWLKARQYLGLVLAPALVMIGLADFAATSWVETHFGASIAWLALPLLGAMLVLLPLAVRRLWPTSPLPVGPLRKQLFRVCTKKKVGIREILVWHTHDQNANAAVAGFVPGLRFVFLTDGLLRRLSADEVAAVLRHELGHIAGRHLPLRLLLLALPIAGFLGWNAALPQTGEELARLLTGAGIPHGLQVSLLVPAGLLAYAVLVVGRYSRWLEHDADLAACRGTSGTLDSTEKQCFIEALVKVVGRTRESRLASWLHPALDERVTFLDRAQADSRFATSFCRRLRWTAWAILGIYGLVALAIALGAVGIAH